MKERAKSNVKKSQKSPFPKLAILCDCSSHLILGLRTDQGPGPDYEYFQPLLDQATRKTRITRLLADAGFDSETNHTYARHEHGTAAIIPPTSGRPSDKPPVGKFRRRMKTLWEQYRKEYGQRSQVETSNSMLKRLLGSALRATSGWGRHREMSLRVLTLNLMILAHHA